MHATSFLLFVLANVHGFASGADAGNPLMRWFALATTTIVLFLILYRTLVPRRAATARAKGKGSIRGA